MRPVTQVTKDRNKKSRPGKGRLELKSKGNYKAVLNLFIKFLFTSSGIGLPYIYAVKGKIKLMKCRLPVKTDLLW